MLRAGDTSKAVVLAAGRGTRMRRPDAGAVLEAAQAAAAEAGAKAMMPLVAGRPFLDWVLSSLADAGIARVCLVVAPGDQAIRARYAGPGRSAHRPAGAAPDRRRAPASRLEIELAVQEEPLGTADALLAAAAFAAGEDFLALNSDNAYPVSAVRALRQLDGPGLPVFTRRTLTEGSNLPPERIARFALVRVGADGFLESIVEKPDAAELAALGDRALVSMNLWRFSPAIFEACRRVPLSSRGERELPQAVGVAIAELGQRFRAIPCAEPVLDLSSRADVARVAERLRGIEPRL